MGGDDETVRLTRAVGAETLGTRDGVDLPPPASVMIEVPKKLGAVNLVKQIGQGGMGVVWLGRHELLNRDVAVKFLLNLEADESDPGFASLLEGARAAAAIPHRGLNAVLHADVIERVPFLVMEYVDGPTVSQLLTRLERLSPAMTRCLMEALCAAAGELHDNGVVHRDIKPSNVLLNVDGMPVLTDFGLACWKAGGDLSFSVKGIAGTPVYMAPEVWEKQVSARSDVYALGIMLYEMLTGEPPFDGAPSYLWECHRSQTLPQDVMSQIDTNVAQVIERATNKNPLFRYKSARHMQRAVEQAFEAMDPMCVAKARGQSELIHAIGKIMKGQDDLKLSDAPKERGTYYDRLGTLADVRKRATGDSGPLSESLVERVQDSVPCIRCKQDLKGEPVTGRCPSCLLLIKATVSGQGSGWCIPETRAEPMATKEPERPQGGMPQNVPAGNADGAGKETPGGMMGKLRRFLRDCFSR
jgi:serine/threonine protein kinase